MWLSNIMSLDDTVINLPITTQCCILTHLRYIGVENIVRKAEIACYRQFLLSHNVFYPIGHLFFISNALQNVIFNLFQFGPI